MSSELKFLSDDEVQVLRDALAARYTGPDFDRKLAMLCEWAGQVRLGVVMLDELLDGRLQVADIKPNGEPAFALATGAFVDPTFR